MKPKTAAEIQKEAEKQAELNKNQISQAQKDLNEDKCDNCNKKNTLVTKQHEGTLVCTSCGVVQQINMID